MYHDREPSQYVDVQKKEVFSPFCHCHTVKRKKTEFFPRAFVKNFYGAVQITLPSEILGRLGLKVYSSG